MLNRRLAPLALAVVLGASTAAADEPKLPDAKAFDKLVDATLRDVHNKGADLYNGARDFAGTYRLYQGSLETVRPLLAHRPDAQKIIETGLTAADREPDVARKAYVLHDTIESLRKNLKGATAQPKTESPMEKKPDEPKTPPAKKPDEPMKPTPPVTTPPTEKKPDDVKKPADPPKPNPLPVAPPPKEVKPEKP